VLLSAIHVPLDAAHVLLSAIHILLNAVQVLRAVETAPPLSSTPAVPYELHGKRTSPDHTSRERHPAGFRP